MSYQVHVLESGQVLNVSEGEKLLDAAVRQGERAILQGCRGGGCGMCKVRVITGDYDLVGKCSVVVLPPGDRQAGYVLSCKTVMKSNAVISVSSTSESFNT
ncbi:2Fe-2S iron-sulfur cluster-binding protein [Alicyclobacillus fastidiosus]|uniref:2Fe-2S iron-sulfur cluster-binding protein n=1 Tax=Alicyclobacillus fastidiosus TaxID=392011 RepID=UPI0034D4C661